MENATGDSIHGVKTRSKRLDSAEDKQPLKNISNLHPEVNALVQDQIFQKFVEKTVNPNNGPLTEDLSEDFVPNEDSVIEVDDGGSSEDDLDEEENVNPANEDEIAEVNLDAKQFQEAAEGNPTWLKNLPPAMAAAYKKRFPYFWRMKEGLVAHTGDGYDHEEDPDFQEKKRDETIELSSGSESDSDESSSEEEDEEEMVKEEELADLTAMVEDMAIPDDSILEEAVEEAIDANNDEESATDESDDEIDTNEPDHLDLLDDQKDMVFENDVDYQPLEGDDDIDDESDDSYTSANEEDVEESSDDDDESEQVETMEAMDE